MAESRRNCELCTAEAKVYCPSDSAFLCRSCDAKVHGANFLVARHLRSSLCSNCGSSDGKRFSGAGISFPARNLCRSCSPERFPGDGEGEIDSLSSSCVSSTTDAGEEAAARMRREKGGDGGGGGVVAVAVDKKVEGVLVNWCRRMAVDERRVVPTAMELLGGCFNRMTNMPFRVSLTASLWVAFRLCGGGATCQDLRKLEQISGVPAKLLLATESRLARALKRRRSRENHEEGWAEC